MNSSSWIGIDLDGTLAEYNGWEGPEHIGIPIPSMVKILKLLIEKGYNVKIFTARAYVSTNIPIVKKWLSDNLLPDLEITNIKDFNMILLIDDRCIQVEKNTGRLIGNEILNFI